MLLQFIILSFAFFFLQVSCEDASCSQGACFPPLGNLLIGRSNRLTATSTEGDNTVANIISSNQTRSKYWKSENGLTTASVRLNLEAEFYLDSISIEFQHAEDKPKAMLIEKSKDFGQTWRTFHYFADNCEQSFPGIITGQRRTSEDVVTSFCSQHDLGAKKISLKLVPEDISMDLERKYYFSRVTNLRLNLTELRESMTSFKILNMNVAGSCSCYGHASKCIPEEGFVYEGVFPGQVFSKCDCIHNTQGVNCETCQELYNDRSWSPGYADNFQCQKCNCNNRATQCFFDPIYFEMSNQTTGGVCIGCSYSLGKHCERCKSFFYLDSTENSCRPCNCDPNGSFTRLCDGDTGQCPCKSGSVGRDCSQDRSTVTNIQMK